MDEIPPSEQLNRRDFMGVSSSAFLLNSIAPALNALKLAAAAPPPRWNAGHNLAAAHARLGNSVGQDNLAAGVRLGWLSEYFQRDLALLQSASQPVPTSLKNLSVKLVVAPTDLTIGQDATSKQPTISGKFSLTFMPSDDLTVQFRTRVVTFSSVKLRLINDPVASGEFAFSVDGTAQPTVLPSSAPPDAHLISKYYGGISSQYEIQETAVLLVGMSAILEQFAAMTPFPQIRRALRTFRLGDPIHTVYDDEYVLVAGKPILDVKPCADSGTQFRITANTGNKFQVDAATPPLTDCNTELPALVDFIFLHPKMTTLFAWAQNNVAPSLTATNQGPFLFLAYWKYVVTLLLQSFDVSYVLSPTPSILFTTSWNVEGDVEGGINVGCVQQRLADVQIGGTVGPIVVVISPCLDGTKLCLQTDVPSGIPNNLNWTVNPLPWPWNKIAGDILGQIIHGVMPSMGPIIDLFRICLVDLGGLLNNPASNGSDSDLAVDSTVAGIRVYQERPSQQA